MKKIIIFTLALLLFNSCISHKNIAKEREAIKTVIENETNAYLRRDAIQESKSFLHDDSVIVLVSGKKSYGYAVGFNQIKNSYQLNFKQKPSTDTFKNSNYKFKIYKKTAWVVYDEKMYSETGAFIEKIINVRFLEKIAGAWKIVYLSHVNTSSYETAKE